MISRGISSFLRALITLYQWTLSAFIGRTCRFEPSCSHYMSEAILVHGPIKGVWLGLKRIARCHPWGGAGYDPVPPYTCKHHHSTTPNV
ncbi:MAG: membrane protein insertion efficiency factor YidD [Rhodospirillaceae bacterium]|nr:membrane protein insertion efficiency factor YidD [Rhodospirillaceae bacterium]